MRLGTERNRDCEPIVRGDERETSDSWRSYNCTEGCVQNLSSGASAPGDNDPHENYGGSGSRSRSRISFVRCRFLIAYCPTSTRSTCIFIFFIVSFFMFSIERLNIFTCGYFFKLMSQSLYSNVFVLYLHIFPVSFFLSSLYPVLKVQLFSYFLIIRILVR